MFDPPYFRDISNTIAEFKKILILVLIGLFTGCQIPATAKKISTSDNADFLLLQGNKYWEKRHEIKQASTAYLFYKRAAGLSPDNLDLLIRYSHACYFVGHFIETDQALKDSLFLEGINAGEKALFLSEAFSATFENAVGDSSTRKIAAIANTPRELIDALYWWSANSGRYLAYKPAMMRLAHQEIIETAMYRILATEPDYYYGAANRFFGALYARIPGIELTRSKDYFDTAIEKHPNYFGTYTLRAEFYHTKAGNREQFHDDLTWVIEADPTVLPDVMAENILEQEYAKRLLEREHLLFE